MPWARRSCHRSSATPTSCLETHAGPGARQPGTAITYAIDTTADAVPPSGTLGGATTDAAIVRAMDTWNSVVCSNLGLVRNVPPPGTDIGEFAFFVTGGAAGGLGAFADIQHAGFLDLDFGGGILGVTVTGIFVVPGPPVGPPFVPSDIDADGKVDVAAREIYYDPFIGSGGPPWPWSDDGVSNVDLETVAIHEAGHGLSQAHFGNLFTGNNGNFKQSPRAVMEPVLRRTATAAARNRQRRPLQQLGPVATELDTSRSEAGPRQTRKTRSSPGAHFRSPYL